MQGKLIGKTLLTARLYEPKDKSLGVDFLREHPVTNYPELYKEVKKGKRVVNGRCITTAYCTFLALMHQTETTVIGDFKYHDSGIGVGAEAASDVGLGTPWGGARDIGSQVADGVTYTSVATTTYNATKAITEHGLFSAATGATLMDRSVFAALNVVSGNQIQWTYTITFTAGG